ncbi:hypothetical protein HanRHA438_Chr07g0293401 [Helianthus annuus]|uniref:Transposase (Putative), gypsy type n=1 Tax=Helianthus annuus TaxID=4232 RepID=A0A9K3IJB4_HELAN|nr:hypothetical protein HanXRQr2_Chr07g0282851 [Helianthus annuus]KAJ0549338.1 hypothetical protein HanHA300_Chr07g0232441 [Helianthus annuus]KAJ0555669.1 hypothetical protein HanIR_Chr07g0304751 [Helianthus annuus]KAJ0562291.1 hypothetical protein HanHA89_Chr07g0249601 [Helianthus annuus]KAJ0730465.1 hypothetical protein HanOQP8_Chr07g0240311 [Helianthus annuus]
MGAHKDLAKSFSRLTQEEVEAFCLEWSIGLRFKMVPPGCDVSIDRCPPGSVALYCRHFEFSNLRHPFSNFVLNGLARVLHFEVLCRASGYDPTLLSFRRFFRLAKNSDWFTFETSQVDTCLVSSMVSSLGVWKDRFFWVSDEIVPFKMVWRHPDAFLNEPKPSALEINTHFLETIRECPSRVCPFPDPLLVMLGISKLWDRPDRDPVLMRDGQGIRLFCFMSLLDLVKSDDTFDVVFEDAAATPGEDAIARGSEHRFEGSDYVSVPNVKGFTKVPASKVSTRRLNRRLKSVDQPSGSEAIDISDDIEVSMEQVSEGGVEKENEKELVVAGKKKELVKKGVVPTIQGSSGKSVEGLEEPGAEEVYVPNWGMKVGDSFKDPAVCADVLAHFAPPGV